MQCCIREIATSLPWDNYETLVTVGEMFEEMFEECSRNVQGYRVESEYY
jgi:hypothetical protein